MLWGGGVCRAASWEVARGLPGATSARMVPRTPQGSPMLGEQERKDELPQIWPSPLPASPWAPRVSEDELNPPGQTGKWEEPYKDDPGYPSPQTK